MSAEPGESPSPPGARLNPFLFPSDTTFRFLLLLVAVVGANLYIWNWLWLALDSDVAAGYRSCGRFTRVLDVPGLEPRAYEEARGAFSACTREVQAPLGWWMAGGTALLIVVATTLLLVLPVWIARRHRLRPLSRDEAPAVIEELRSLVREAGLDEEPRWLWNPLDPSPTGLAFGRPGRHAVALMGGLVTRQIADPPAFRAVVRHELAHLRNRDVDLTYATVSLWYAFLVAGVLPFAFVVTDEGLGTILALGWRLIALAALVYLTRNAVLRAREVYADVRASVPDGSQGALRRILAGSPRGSTSLWRRLWRVHPDPQARLAAVNDTGRLFPLDLLVIFGTGIATTIAYESIVTFVGIYVRDPFSTRLIAAAPVALLAMGVVGVGIWRGTWGALAEDQARPRSWLFALAFGAGFVVGPQLALERAIRLEGESTLLESAFGSGAPWIILLFASLVLVLAWVAASAATWIRALAGNERPALTTLAGLLFAGGFLAVLIAVFTYARDTRSVIGQLPAAEHSLSADIAWVGPEWLWNAVFDLWALELFSRPVVVLTLVVLWLFPLAAWLRRRSHLGDAPWVFLEEGGRLHVPLLGRLSLEPLLIGSIVGVACFGAYIVLRLGLRAGFDPDTRLELGFAVAFTYWQYLIAFGAQAVAGGAAAARARELPLVATLAAAFTVAVFATAGMEILSTAAGCVEPIALRASSCDWDMTAGGVWFNFRIVLVEGAVAALAAGLVVLGVRALGRRKPAPVSAPAP